MQLNPITLAYPPTPPFGLSNYLSNIPTKLFLLPILLAKEKDGTFMKGPGALGEFLVKKMKKEMHGGSSSEDEAQRKVYKPVFF